MTRKAGYMSALSITPANVIPSANAQYTHGRFALSAITAGQPLYKTAAGLMAPADANGVAPLNVVEGIAANNAAAGQPVSYVTEDPALQIAASGLTIGDTLILGATPGDIAPDADCASGWFKTILGTVVSATAINLKLLRTGVAKA